MTLAVVAGVGNRVPLRWLVRLPERLTGNSADERGRSCVDQLLMGNPGRDAGAIGDTGEFGAHSRSSRADCEKSIVWRSSCLFSVEPHTPSQGGSSP